MPFAGHATLEASAMRDDAFDVAIVGGGPAGLSAALLLGRCCRRVVVCDHGKPRNYAAKAVHGYLGLDGIEPAELRRRGREQCATYGVEFRQGEVITARQDETAQRTAFQLLLKDGTILRSRKLLLATGVEDALPPLLNIEEFYGSSVHHCPYCDAWEHHDEHLVAFGCGSSAIDLAVMLRNWSAKVTACTHGHVISGAEARRLRAHGINHRDQVVADLMGVNGKLEALSFVSGELLYCDALFFSAPQGQRSALPSMLGCQCDKDGLMVARKKQGSGVPGLFLTGDADGDVQFAIVAAAEGAIAATVIHQELLNEDELTRTTDGGLL
jgi:thioredoxin reductase